MNNKLSTFATIAGLGVYLVIVAYFALDALVSAWVGGYNYLLLAKSFNETPVPLSVKLAYITMAGGVLGGVLRSLKGLHQYGVIAGSFQARYIISYLACPFISILLAFVIYIFTKAGLLVFGSVSGPSALNSSIFCSYVATGFIAGFAWERVVEKCSGLADQLFSKPNE